MGGSLAVAVTPGSLSISPTPSLLTLERGPGTGRTTRYVGLLPVVRVIDTRGSLLGWDATVTFFRPSSIPATDLRLRVHPGRPTVASGQSKGIRSAVPEWIAFDTQVALFAAEPGYGAGAYDEDARIELVLPFASDVAAIDLAYATSVS